MVDVPTCAKFVQVDEPWQRSTRYSVTATLSVDGVHDSVILVPATVPLRLLGAVGAVVSRAAVVMAATGE